MHFISLKTVLAALFFIWELVLQGCEAMVGQSAKVNIQFLFSLSSLEKLTFTHRADGAPGLVRPACDGATAFHLMALWTRDAHRLSDMEHPLGDVPVGVVPPAWGRWAGQSCQGQQEFLFLHYYHIVHFHTVQ